MNNVVKINTARNSRDLNIDFLRVISAILVVSTHTFAPFAVQNILFARVLNTFATIAVPVFFILSGYSLLFTLRRYPNITFWGLIKHEFKRLIVPYLGWSLFYYLYTLTYNHDALSLRYLIGRLIYGNMWYHTYFLLIMIIQYPIMLWFWKLVQKKLTPFLFAFLLVTPIIELIAPRFISSQLINRLLWLSPLQWGIYFLIGLLWHKYDLFKKIGISTVFGSLVVALLTLILALNIQKLGLGSFQE